MNRNKHRTVLVLAVVAVVVAAASAVGEEDVTRTFSVSSGQKIDIDLRSGGSLSIEGWDENKVEIEYYEGRGNLESFDIQIKETGGGIELTAELDDRWTRSSSLYFRIKVPRKFNVELFTAGGGMEFRGFEGDIRGKSRGGAIALEDMKGEVRLKTNGGAIEVSDCELDGTIETNGGELNLDNVVGDLRVETNGGSIRYRNVRIGDDARGAVSASTGGGSIDVDGAPGGVSVRTGGGEIEVANAARLVEARTGGGDIDVHTRNGRVEAATGAGDIKVVVDESPGKLEGGIELLTGTGDVTLTLPADFSADFDIDLAYTRNSRRDYSIKCDFDIELEHTQEWDYGNGSPRKHIYGRGVVKGGNHKIRIKTVNGDVRIIKK